MKIGWMELLVVAIVALIVIGPDKFPEYAKKFGQVLKEIRKVTSELTEEIQKDVVEPLNEVAKPLKEAVLPSLLFSPLHYSRVLIDKLKESLLKARRIPPGHCQLFLNPF